MKAMARRVIEDFTASPSCSGSVGPAFRSNYLHLVTSHELGELRNALAKERLPLDFEAKLVELAGGDLVHHFLEQNCRTFLALLLAAQGGAFKGANSAECERLLRVLAYVRKNDDAIPDYRPDGFADDLVEVRAVAAEFKPLLHAF